MKQRVAGQSGVGIIAGVIDGSRVTVYQAGSSGTRRPLDAHTLFEIGSVTKTFTATILASMARDGSARLNDPVRRYVPANVHVPSRNGKQITLLNLATQHSGLPEVPGNMHPENRQNTYADYSLRDLYAFLNGYRLTRDPGASFEYSNLGIALLGDALAYRAHMTYASLLRQRVLEPLGMRETTIALRGAQRERLALGHNGDGDVAIPWDFNAIAPAGGIRSSLTDMLAYVRCNMGQGPLARTCLFAQQPRDTFPGHRIGLVWWIGTAYPIVHHQGDTYGYHAAVAVSRDHRRGVVVLSNGGDPVGDLALHLIDARVPLPVKAVTPVVRLDTRTLDEYAGTYVNAASGEKYVVRRDGTRLLAALAAQPFAGIYASAKDRFFYKVVDAQVEFARDAGGRVNGLVLRQDGNTTVYARPGMTPPAAPPSPTQPPSVTLDPATLDEYVGTYAASGNFTITVRRDGDRLSLQATAQPALPMYASAKDRFFLTAAPAKIDFVRDAAGRVHQLVVHQGGQDLTATKR